MRRVLFADSEPHIQQLCREELQDEGYEVAVAGSGGDVVRLLEAFHLNTTLGDRLWEGWGSANIPAIIWNRSYEFLVNYDGDTPDGWSSVTDEELNGQTYFRGKAANPQNFAVRIGDVWSASMATKQTTDHFLIGVFQDNLPGPLKKVFPYRFLIQPTEIQMGGLLHETFHVYQTGNCLFSCAGGGCELECQNVGNCVNTCSGNGCSMTCTGTGNCSLWGCTSGCTRVCRNLGTCT